VSPDPDPRAGFALSAQDGTVRIVACTLETLDAEDDGGPALARALNSADPLSWPPEHNDASTRDWMRSLIRDHPDRPGWGSWYILANGRPVGICGYQGPPDGSGCVEIGYSVVGGDQRQGYAGRAVTLLVARAFSDPQVAVIAAGTLPALIASQRVLIRQGFVLTGSSFDDEVGEILRFTLNRPQPT
jgi:ribosomal-protein-alanine N-acetyltransferase